MSTLAALRHDRAQLGLGLAIAALGTALNVDALAQWLRHTAA